MMARELMAITGLSAQELVRLARSAFGTAGGAVSATVSAERAAVLGIFCHDRTTGDGMGLCLIGNCPLLVYRCMVDCMRCKHVRCVYSIGCVDLPASHDRQCIFRY